MENDAYDWDDYEESVSVAEQLRLIIWIIIASLIPVSLLIALVT